MVFGNGTGDMFIAKDTSGSLASESSVSEDTTQHLLRRADGAVHPLKEHGQLTYAQAEKGRSEFDGSSSQVADRRLSQVDWESLCICVYVGPLRPIQAALRTTFPSKLTSHRVKKATADIREPTDFT